MWLHFECSAPSAKVPECHKLKTVG